MVVTSTAVVVFLAAETMGFETPWKYEITESWQTLSKHWTYIIIYKAGGNLEGTLANSYEALLPLYGFRALLGEYPEATTLLILHLNSE